MAGTKSGYVQSYLNKFMWRFMNCTSRVSTFDEFIELIRKFYKTETSSLVEENKVCLVENNLIQDVVNQIDLQTQNAHEEYDFEIEDDENDLDVENSIVDLDNEDLDASDDSVNILVEGLEKVKLNKKKSVFSETLSESNMKKNYE